MAGIKDIIDELKTIETAFTATNFFIFGERSDINDDRAKNYPGILVDARDIDDDWQQVDGQKFLPQKRDWKVRIFMYDTYQVSEEKATDLQTALDALDDIMAQYIAEIYRRSINEDVGFHVKSVANINGFLSYQQENDDLLQVVKLLTFTTDDKGACTVGTFNY